MKKTYWAYYGTPGEFDLMSDEELQKARGEAVEQCESRPYLWDMFEFPNMAKAIAYLRKHLRGDINDCKAALSDLKEIKKRKVKAKCN
jgi:hypothetical protein